MAGEPDHTPADHSPHGERDRTITRRELIRVGWALPLVITAAAPLVLAAEGEVQPKHGDVKKHLDTQYHQDRAPHADVNNHFDKLTHRDTAAHHDSDPGGSHVDATPHLDNDLHTDTAPHVDAQFHSDTVPHQDFQLHVDVKRDEEGPIA